VTALITGATGVIGHPLLQPGDRGLVRDTALMPGAVRGELLDLTSLAVACNGIETVFHCAGYAHAFASADPDAHWRINFEGTRNLLTVAGGAGVPDPQAYSDRQIYDVIRAAIPHAGHSISPAPTFWGMLGGGCVLPRSALELVLT